MVKQNNFLKDLRLNRNLLGILVDPDKLPLEDVGLLLQNLPENTTHLLVGGSTVENDKTQLLVKAIKAASMLPVIIFPGDYSQIAPQADALLFLSLLSGRNPEYLIGQQIKAVKYLQKTKLEVIPTGYILIDGGKTTAVEKVSQTKPMPQENCKAIVETALTAEYLGKTLIYLEAGSGAKNCVNPTIVKAVAEAVKIPVIVGGGIKTQEQLAAVYKAGGKMAVIGTAFENDLKTVKNKNNKNICRTYTYSHPR